ncbi:hypothetical protein [Flavobacterium rhizosphaerae]|uniref:Adhesin domain-containing protein n=1 Tax=Flavobacterium rhizosphaerae TaxID=3163298 RepID=A0ABW8YU75_9FLAO
MKTTMLNYLLLLLALPFALHAGEVNGKYKKEKRISKTFSVSSNALLDIDNQYGNIYVTTWDENKIAIDVVITVGADKQEVAEKRINAINVDFAATSAKATARTIIGNFSGHKVSMSINYTVKIPKQGSIMLKNIYGSIKTGEINGKANIQCDYGPIDIQSLNGSGNIIEIDYSKVSRIGYVKSLTMSADYSDIVIDQCEKLIFNGDYSLLTIKSVADLSFNGDYGDLKIDSVHNFNGNGDYITLKIKSAKDKVNLTSDYSTIIIDVENTLKSLNFNGDYGNIDIKSSPGFSFDFELNGDYFNVSGLSGANFTKRHQKDEELYLKGYYKAQGKSKINITSDFGNAIFIIK